MDRITREEFLALVVYMKQNYGINLENKQTLVEGRLWPVLNKMGYNSLAEYFENVINDKSGAEAKMLLTRLTTNYTYFMREEQHYNYLVEKILPELTQTLRDRDLRIWSAGCSSGEEPYTTAMVLDNYFGLSKSNWDTKILATDISPSVLEMARQGVFPADRLENLPKAWIDKYFYKEAKDEFRVTDSIKGEVIFRPFNLMEKVFPFKKKFHVIFCRNVMIYFDKKTRDELINRYYNALEPGGYLFIGLSETVSKDESKFIFVKPSIYLKDKDAR